MYEIYCSSRINYYFIKDVYKRQIYNEDTNHVKIHLFIRKNKNDNTSKEFYYLGLMHTYGKPIQTIMPNTNNNVVQFTYKLENEIRKDIFDYITNND